MGIKNYKDNLCIPIIVYSTLSLIIISNFKGYYLLTLDMVFPNKNLFTGYIYGFIPSELGGYGFITAISKLMINESILQKLYLFLIIFISGISMYYLSDTLDIKSKIPKYFAGILYSINPFLYVRFLAGQWLILLAFSIVPLEVKYFIKFIDNQNRKNLIKLIFLVSITGILSLHIFIIILIIYLILTISSHKKISIKTFKNLISFGVFLILINAYWLMPLMTIKDIRVNNITEKDFDTFAPNINGYLGWFEIGAMYGFWNENYKYAKDFLFGWQFLYLIILSISIIGYIYNKDNKIVKAFGLIGIIGFILASGIKGPFSDIVYWLFNNTILKGMRDSHKFVSMMVLSYSFLGALGLSKIQKIKNNLSSKDEKDNKSRYNGKYILAVLLLNLSLIIPIIYSFTFFNGFAGQIKSTDYPGDWYEVNNFLNNDSQDFKVLFLPWHQYINFSWVNDTDKTILNPAPYFFEKDIISGTNIENRLIYREDNLPDQLYIDFLLKNRDNIYNFGNLISILNVKYIILAKDQDYKRYKFLFNQSDLELIKESKTLYLFKNIRNVSKIYEENDIVYIKDWDDLLQISKNEDITNKLYVIGNNNISFNISYKNRKKVVDFEKISPVYYKLSNETEKETEKYIIFTEPYKKDWQLDNQIPFQAYGVVNGYIVGDKSESKSIRFERFYKIYIPSYIISLLTFIALVGIYFDIDKLIWLKIKKK